jgi:uncharacterized protein with HEPN domain
VVQLLGSIIHFQQQEKSLKAFLKNNNEIISTYQSDIIKEKILARIEKIDRILNSYSKLVHQNDEILMDAAKRNLNLLAPNHIQDSFRDTINILTL